jgi:hypothetical protein
MTTKTTKTTTPKPKKIKITPTVKSDIRVSPEDRLSVLSSMPQGVGVQIAVAVSLLVVTATYVVVML